MLYKKNGIEISLKNGNGNIIDISIAKPSSFAYLTLWVDPEWTKVLSFDVKSSHMTFKEISALMESVYTFITISTPKREFTFRGTTIVELLKTIF